MSVPLSKSECLELIEMIRKVQVEVRNLPFADPAFVEWRWKELGEATLAEFRWTSPRVVSLNISNRGMLDWLVSSACHELTHVQQYRDYGLFGFLLRAMPVIRKFTLEREAWAVERVADTVYGRTGLNDDNPVFIQ